MKRTSPPILEGFVLRLYVLSFLRLKFVLAAWNPVRESRPVLISSTHDILFPVRLHHSTSLSLTAYLLGNSARIRRLAGGELSYP
jgi:hypothetical protein